MKPLGATEFDQCVLNISLIHLCNQASHIGQELHKQHYAGAEETDAPMHQLWYEPRWFTIYVPHPDQEYDGLTLEAGLTKGYNIETKVIEDKSNMLYKIPPGGHFVVVLKQKGLNAGYDIAATGIFVRPLAVLSLDVIVDLVAAKYQSIVVKHPIIRNYPTDWERKLRLFINQEIAVEDLPNLVAHVDQELNPDYRPPSWHEVYLAARGFAGV